MIWAAAILWLAGAFQIWLLLRGGGGEDCSQAWRGGAVALALFWPLYGAVFLVMLIAMALAMSRERRAP